MTGGPLARAGDELLSGPRGTWFVADGACIAPQGNVRSGGLHELSKHSLLSDRSVSIRRTCGNVCCLFEAVAEAVAGPHPSRDVDKALGVVARAAEQTVSMLLSESGSEIEFEAN